MTETILMIPTVMYIFNSNIKIFKSYIVIILCAYVITNYMDIDYLVARRNVNRYYVNEKIDIDYLKNYGYDNIPVLVELYNKTDDLYVKEELREYLTIMKEDIDQYSVFTFKLSRYKAYKALEEDFK